MTFHDPGQDEQKNLFTLLLRYDSREQLEAMLAELPDEYVPQAVRDLSLRDLADFVADQALRYGTTAVERLRRAMAEDMPTTETRAFDRRLLARRLKAELAPLGAARTRLKNRVLQELERPGLGVALLVPQDYDGRLFVKHLHRELEGRQPETFPVWLAPRRRTRTVEAFYASVLRDLRRGLEDIVGSPLLPDWDRALPRPDAPASAESFEDTLERLLTGPIASTNGRLVLIVQGLERVQREHLEDWGWMIDRLQRDRPIKLLLWGGLALHRLRSGQVHLQEGSPFQLLVPIELGRFGPEEIARRVAEALGGEHPGAAAIARELTGGHPALLRELLRDGLGHLRGEDAAKAEAQLAVGETLRGLENQHLPVVSPAARETLARLAGGDMTRRGSDPEEELRWLGITCPLDDAPGRWDWTAPVLRAWAERWAGRRAPPRPAPPAREGPALVFISYAQEDEAPPHRWLERVRKHLQPLAGAGLLELWTDQDIRIGERWEDRIRGALATARAAVLLVSPAFMASTFIRETELPLLLERQHRGELELCSVLLRSCSLEGVRFRFPDPRLGPLDATLTELQVANKLTEPLNGLSEAEQDAVLQRLAARLRELVT